LAKNRANLFVAGKATQKIKHLRRLNQQGAEPLSDSAAGTKSNQEPELTGGHKNQGAANKSRPGESATDLVERSTRPKNRSELRLEKAQTVKYKTKIRPGPCHSSSRTKQKKQILEGR
jgi:hypothetical protein